MTLIYIFMRTIPMITIHELRLLVPPVASPVPASGKETLKQV
jgi:hypothetical protein